MIEAECDAEGSSETVSNASTVCSVRKLSSRRPSFRSLKLSISSAARELSIQEELASKGYNHCRIIQNGGSFKVSVAFRGHDKVVTKSTNESSYEGSLVAVLRHEYGILSSLDHPNIVRAMDIIEPDDPSTRGCALIMEFACGETLMRIMPFQRGCMIIERHGILGEVLCAVSYLHDLRIAHRDVHGENVIVDIAGEKGRKVKLVDFGSAQRYEHDALSGDEDDVWDGVLESILPPHMPDRSYRMGDAFARDVFAVGLLSCGVMVAGSAVFTADVFPISCRLEHNLVTLPRPSLTCLSLTKAAKMYLGSLLNLDPQCRPCARDAASQMPGANDWLVQSSITSL